MAAAAGRDRDMKAVKRLWIIKRQHIRFTLVLHLLLWAVLGITPVTEESMKGINKWYKY